MLICFQAESQMRQPTTVALLNLTSVKELNTFSSTLRNDGGFSACLWWDWQRSILPSWQIVLLSKFKKQDGCQLFTVETQFLWGLGIIVIFCSLLHMLAGITRIWTTFHDHLIEATLRGKSNNAAAMGLQAADYLIGYRLVLFFFFKPE